MSLPGFAAEAAVHNVVGVRRDLNPGIFASFSCFACGVGCAACVGACLLLTGPAIPVCLVACGAGCVACYQVFC